jgi:hypothetical protein
VTEAAAAIEADVVAEPVVETAAVVEADVVADPVTEAAAAIEVDVVAEPVVEAAAAIEAELDVVVEVQPVDRFAELVIASDLVNRPIPAPIPAQNPIPPTKAKAAEATKEIPVEDLVGGVVSMVGSGVQGVFSLGGRLFDGVVKGGRGLGSLVGGGKRKAGSDCGSCSPADKSCKK